MAHVDFPEIMERREDVWILDIIPKSSYVHEEAKRAWQNSKNGWINPVYRVALNEAIQTWIKVGLGADHFIWQNKKLGKFATILNTAMAAGNDVIKLAARIHGQCEIHCWVTGKNRDWLADIIEKGLDINLLRQNEGWSSVVDFLRINNQEPVVCSYSVCEDFPGPHVVKDLSKIPNYDKLDSDAFYELDTEKQWALALEGLNPVLEITPDNWDDYYFGDGTTLFNIKTAIFNKGSG